MELVGSLSGEVRVLKKTGGEKKLHSVFEFFFCVDVNLEDKASRVVG